MINIKDVTITKDGDFDRLSLSFDEIDNNGKMVRSNVRMSRLVTDDAIRKNINAIRDYALTIIEQEG